MNKNALYKILNQKEDKYNNNPELIKKLIEYKGEKGHEKIHKNLLKKLINKYVKLNQKLEEKLDEITKLSETDQLTNIYNRVKFKSELKKEIKRVKRYQKKLSLIMFDIDHFKAVNDNYGHDVGDEVLIKITDIVSETIRDTDIFARWGGEEFMVLAPNSNLQQTSKLAERIRKNIANYKINKVGYITCSFGVTQFKQEDQYKTFIKRADNALYQAKENGRNQVVNI